MPSRPFTNYAVVPSVADAQAELAAAHDDLYALFNEVGRSLSGRIDEAFGRYLAARDNVDAAWFGERMAEKTYTRPDAVMVVEVHRLDLPGASGNYDSGEYLTPAEALDAAAELLASAHGLLSDEDA